MILAFTTNEPSRSEFSEIADQSDGRDGCSIRIRKGGDADMIFPLAEQDLANGLHDLSDFDALGTADIAGVAGGANPDGLGFQKFLFQAELGEADDLVGKDVHLGNSRASGRAFAALVAGEEFLAADLLDFLDEIVADFIF